MANRQISQDVTGRRQAETALIDATRERPSARRCGTQRIVDELFGSRRITKRPQHIAGTQERESGAVAISQLAGADIREHSLRLLAPPRPRQCVRPNKVGFRSRSGMYCRLCESLREVQVAQPDRAVRRPQEQIGVGCEVAVETQRSAAHDDADFVAVAGCCELSGDKSA